MPLEDVIATELLSKRQPMPEQLAALEAMRDEAGAPGSLSMDTGCRLAMKACHAESAGVSLFSHSRYDELTWIATSGHLARFEGRRFPQRHSMCGVCFARDAPQLFLKPHKHFQWMEMAGIGIREALVVPLKSQSGQFHGTLWVMTHAKDHVRFNWVDVDMLGLIAARLSFTAFARSADQPHGTDV